jgi:dihydrofolate reductase
MGQLIVLSFTTLDGVVEDPDGSGGTDFGGWAMRQGPAAVAGDKFGLGSILETGVLLFGRRTWEQFSRLWPPRDDAFSSRMNAAAKAVVTSRDLETSGWSNSTVVRGPVEEWVRATRGSRDVVVIGSVSLVSRLVAAGMVDEYRLLTFPVVAGSGRRLLTKPMDLRLVSSESSPYAVLSTYRPVAAAAA